MNLKDFERGWIVGDFSPALASTKDVEVGVLELPKGHKGDGHYHLKHIEYNIVLSGQAKVGDKIYQRGDIFIYTPEQRSYVEFLEDTQLLVVKTPATKHDKHY